MAAHQASSTSPLQSLCQQGQEQLARMDYLRAEQTLAQAEAMAFAQEDFDTLSRLYMPLQEARRQRRQRCGEGIMHLRLLAQGPEDRIDPRRIVEHYPHGQLLVAGWGTIAPALELRRLQAERLLYVETFLAAVYPSGHGRAIAIVPQTQTRLPEPIDRPVDELVRLLPPHSIVLAENELPPGPQAGSADTYGRVMDLWEQLHQPFLAAARMQRDPRLRIEHLRKTLEVDYACERAHQEASDAARDLARRIQA